MNSTDMDKLGKIEKWSGNGTAIAKIKNKPTWVTEEAGEVGVPSEKCCRREW